MSPKTTVRLGQARSTRRPDELQPIDAGTCVVTDRRFVFLGRTRAVTWELRKLLTISGWIHGSLCSMSPTDSRRRESSTSEAPMMVWASRLRPRWRDSKDGQRFLRANETSVLTDQVAGAGQDPDSGRAAHGSEARRPSADEYRDQSVARTARDDRTTRAKAPVENLVPGSMGLVALKVALRV